MPSKIAMELAWKMTGACIDDAAVIDTYLQAQREAAWAEAVEAAANICETKQEMHKSYGGRGNCGELGDAPEGSLTGKTYAKAIRALRPPMETKES